MSEIVLGFVIGICIYMLFHKPERRITMTTQRKAYKPWLNPEAWNRQRIIEDQDINGSNGEDDDDEEEVMRNYRKFHERLKREENARDRGK